MEQRSNSLVAQSKNETPLLFVASAASRSTTSDVCKQLAKKLTRGRSKVKVLKREQPIFLH